MPIGLNFFLLSLSLSLFFSTNHGSRSADHNCIMSIDADSDIATLRSRSNVINGISTGRRVRFRDNNTVTVTIMAGDNDGGNSDSSIFVSSS